MMPTQFASNRIILKIWIATQITYFRDPLSNLIWEPDSAQPPSPLPPPPSSPIPPLSPSFVFRYPKFLTRPSSTSSSVHSLESTGVSKSDTTTISTTPDTKTINFPLLQTQVARYLRFEALRKRASKQGAADPILMILMYTNW
uniref:Uncharacterized protein n=1 Tax=Tetranychus urticae TaxID=32264 RepID=T1KUG1_TETUR